MKKLVVDENSPQFASSGMNFREFSSDINYIRKYAAIVVRGVPIKYREINLLEQQVSEIIKNAIEHGSRNDPSKKIKVWYKCFRSKKIFRLIVEDQGNGFVNLDDWNEFCEKRNYYFEKQDYDNMMKYISYKTSESKESDGGNALFAAIEFWNGGIVFNNMKNKVAMTKIWK